MSNVATQRNEHGRKPTETRIVPSVRGFEQGFTVERVEDGKVTGFTQQFKTRRSAARCLTDPAYSWLHRSDSVCDHGCERFCWGHSVAS